MIILIRNLNSINSKKFVFRKYIYGTILSVIVSSCSSTKQILDNYEGNNELHYFNNMNLNDSLSNVDSLELHDLRNTNVIYFPLNKYCVLPNFFSILDKHAVFLRNNPFFTVKIEGHTDERGTPEYNIALGERRAYSIKVYLESKGVLSNQIHTVSYGKEKPIDLNHTEAAYSKNRRAVLLY